MDAAQLAALAERQPWKIRCRQYQAAEAALAEGVATRLEGAPEVDVSPTSESLWGFTVAGLFDTHPRVVAVSLGTDQMPPFV